MTKLTLYAIVALSLTGCFRAADLGRLRREIERENVGFFADAGSAWLADEADFDLQVSGGLGLHRDNFRLYIARPVSNQRRDLDLSLRFSRTF